MQGKGWTEWQQVPVTSNPIPERTHHVEPPRLSSLSLCFSVRRVIPFALRLLRRLSPIFVSFEVSSMHSRD